LFIAIPEPDRCASKAKSTYYYWEPNHSSCQSVAAAAAAVSVYTREFSAKTSTKAISMKNGFPEVFHLIFPGIE
jgi:hypothetical protein